MITLKKIRLVSQVRQEKDAIKTLYRLYKDI